MARDGERELANWWWPSIHLQSYKLPKTIEVPNSGYQSRSKIVDISRTKSGAIIWPPPFNLIRRKCLTWFYHDTSF